MIRSSGIDGDDERGENVEAEGDHLFLSLHSDLIMSSSGGVFPLPLLEPVQSRTPSPQHPNPTKFHLSSPVKPVVQHFAEHKRDEVQAFGYDKDLHHLGDFGEQDFLDFLRVDEAFLNVETPSAKLTGKQPSGKRRSGRKMKASGNKARGRKASGKGSAEGSSKATPDASEFGHKNFVQAANILAKSMKQKHEYLLSL